MDKEKKDTRAFVYDTWYNQMVDLGESDKALGYDYIKAVLDTQFYGEYDDSNPVIKALMRSTGFSIDRAHNNYNQCVSNGTKGKRGRKYDYNYIASLRDEGKSNKEIMDIVGCSEKTISNAISTVEKERAAQLELERQKWAGQF